MAVGGVWNRRVWAPGWRLKTFHRSCVLGAWKSRPVAAAQAALHASGQPAKQRDRRLRDMQMGFMRPQDQLQAHTVNRLRQGARDLILRHSRKTTPNVLYSRRGTNLEAVSQGESGAVQPPVRSAKHRFLPETRSRQYTAQPSSVLTCRWRCAFSSRSSEGTSLHTK